jgi:AcrR family transcriptional regulator
VSDADRVQRSYHHGNLRSVIMQAAAEAIRETGAANLSLRELARRAGVSHAAPAHHFRDKAGLLTALAAEGFDLLADTLTTALQQTGSLLEMGVAYVHFATTHPAHFEVMFSTDLYHPDDGDLVASRDRATRALSEGVARTPSAGSTGREARLASLAAWSIVHGFATLWLGHAFPSDVGSQPEEAARAVISRLFDQPFP